MKCGNWGSSSSSDVRTTRNDGNPHPGSIVPSDKRFDNFPIQTRLSFSRRSLIDASPRISDSRDASMDARLDQSHHRSHTLRGPHIRGRLTPEECADITHWFEKWDDEGRLSIRDVAELVSRFPVLERAIQAAAGSVLWGGMKPSSTTHAVAMLGTRRTLQMIRTLSGSPIRTSPTG